MAAKNAAMTAERDAVAAKQEQQQALITSTPTAESAEPQPPDAQQCGGAHKRSDGRARSSHTRVADSSAQRKLEEEIKALKASLEESKRSR